MTVPRSLLRMARGLGVWMLAASAVAQPLPPPPPAPAARPLQAPTPPDTLRPAVAADAPWSLAPPQVRTLPGDTLQAIRADPAYRYTDPVMERRSFADRVREAILRLLERMFGAVGSRGMTWIAITLAVVAVGWGLSRLLRADTGGLFGDRDRRRTAVGDVLLDVEDIAEVDLATRLDAARAAGDVRAALRLRYLLVLQTLAAAGAIGWARDKTNRTYAAEVRAWDAAHGTALARPFAAATRLFERVWYGGLVVAPRHLDRLDADADAVEQALPVPA